MSGINPEILLTAKCRLNDLWPPGHVLLLPPDKIQNLYYQKRTILKKSIYERLLDHFTKNLTCYFIFALVNS